MNDFVQAIDHLTSTS